jgi:hypothetical protein
LPNDVEVNASRSVGNNVSDNGVNVLINGMASQSVLAALLDDGDAASFQLMGEDLALVPGARLGPAAAMYDAELARLDPSLREPFEREQAAVLREAHGWLRKYNRSVHARLRGYLALGRRCDFAYPWPVVAMLGICQVLTGMGRNRLYSMFAPVARRLGYRALDELVDGTEDVLRRTNRGIFADSVPTVLMALRAHELRARGERGLGDALLDGPLPPVMDAECRRVMRALADGMAIADGEARFRVLARLTLEHFAREQAIFTYHLGAPGDRGRGVPSTARNGAAPRSPREGGGRSAATPSRQPALVRRLLALPAVPAPVVERRWLGGRCVVFKPFALPAGFDMRDHDARVELFGRAFVSSVTGDREDYLAAVRYVEKRFGAPTRTHS